MGSGTPGTLSVVRGGRHLLSHPNFAKRQRFELRVLLCRQSGEVSKRLYYVKLHGLDLYSGVVDDQTERPSFRTSFHQSGQSNLHYRDRRIKVEHRVAPAKVDLPVLIDLASFGAPDPKMAWGYRPKPQSPTRTTLAVDFDEFPLTWIALYAVGLGRENAVARLLDPAVWITDLVEHRVVNSTMPNLVVIVGGMSAADVEANQRRFVGTPLESSRPTAMVPEPPNLWPDSRRLGLPIAEAPRRPR